MTRSQIPWWKLMLLIAVHRDLDAVLREHAGAVDDAVVVTTKCVKFQFRYSMHEPDRPRRARATPHDRRTTVRGRAVESAKTRIKHDQEQPTPATMCLAKNHQCGRRSSATSSPSLSSRCGYGMPRIVCRPRDARRAHGRGTSARRSSRRRRRSSSSSVGVEVLGDQEAARPLGVAGSGRRARRARDRGAATSRCASSWTST